MFFSNPSVIASWLHICIDKATGSPDQYLPLYNLRRWARWVHRVGTSMHLEEHQELSKLTSNFINDMQRIIDTWGVTLAQSPDKIMDEAQVFTNSCFLPSTTTTKVTSLAPKPIDNLEMSSRPLCTVSITATELNINAVLSIWPSKEYEQRWRALRANDSISRMEEVCANWTARYEVWEASGQNRIADMRIAVNEQEIWLHLRQSLYEKDVGDWSTSFPLEISKNAQSFVILRTVYLFRPPNDSAPASHQRVVLPMDVMGTHSSRRVKDMKSPDRRPTNSHAPSRPLHLYRRLLSRRAVRVYIREGLAR